MPHTLDIEDIKVFGEDTESVAIPEDLFFENRRKGDLIVNTLPLPADVPCWYHAEFKGQPIHFARNSDKIYIIADTTVFGFCLFKFIFDPDDSHFKVAREGGNKIINSERGQQLMSTTNSLSNLVGRFQNSVNTMDVNGSAPTMQPTAHEGASNKIDFRRLHAEIVSRGYVAGFIMGNAPAISFGLVTSKTSDGASETKIVLRESKPSRVLGVAMSLPANCVQRSGSLASPSEISQGLVDYDPNDKTSMVNQVFPVSAAIGYISAFGGKIPECAITTLGEREQWSTKDILSGNPQVAYVYVKATERKGRSSSQERFSFSLKSTSPRKSLYDVGNIVCLRALEHTDVKCNSEKRAMELNNIAFGQWGYAVRKNEPQSKLQKAYNACPTLLWKQNYNIDGKDIAGIGSAFFMAGDKTTSEAGETIPQQDLVYRPWYHTGDRRTEKAEVAKSIVLRTLRPASDGKKEAMVTTAITFEKDPNNACFRPYTRFIDFLVSNGFTTREKLGKMGGRASKAQQKAYGQLSADQQTSMKSFLARAEVAQGIQDVRDAFINASLERAAE